MSDKPDWADDEANEALSECPTQMYDDNVAAALRKTADDNYRKGQLEVLRQLADMWDAILPSMFDSMKSISISAREQADKIERGQ